MLSGGFGRSEVWGAFFFCVFAKHIRKRKSRSLGLRPAPLKTRGKAKARGTPLGMTSCCLGASGR
jgi:hypothetical protein